MRRSLVVLLGLVAWAPASRAQDAATGDAAAGEKVFLQCRACHQVGPNARNQIGPVLNGLFGRTAGHVESYSYSEANKKSGLTWDEATFRDYIRDPKAKVPGTKMIYAGLKDEKRVSDLIAYLHTFDAAPVSLVK
jgi:cytochrome c